MHDNSCTLEVVLYGLPVHFVVSSGYFLASLQPSILTSFFLLSFFALITFFVGGCVLSLCKASLEFSNFKNSLAFL